MPIQFGSWISCDLRFSTEWVVVWILLWSWVVRSLCTCFEAASVKCSANSLAEWFSVKCYQKLSPSIPKKKARALEEAKISWKVQFQMGRRLGWNHRNCLPSSVVHIWKKDTSIKPFIMAEEISLALQPPSWYLADTSIAVLCRITIWRMDGFSWC